jgi:hypothetical protein
MHADKHISNIQSEMTKVEIVSDHLKILQAFIDALLESRRDRCQCKEFVGGELSH